MDTERKGRTTRLSKNFWWAASTLPPKWIAAMEVAPMPTRQPKAKAKVSKGMTMAIVARPVVSAVAHEKTVGHNLTDLHALSQHSGNGIFNNQRNSTLFVPSSLS